MRWFAWGCFVFTEELGLAASMDFGKGFSGSST